MDREHDDDMQEMIEEFAEDLGRSHNRTDELQGPENSSLLPFQERTVLWASIGIVFLISLFSLFSGNDSSREESALLAERLLQIEQRVGLLENTLIQETGNRSSISAIQKTISQLDKGQKSTQKRVNDLGTRINRLENGLTAVQANLKNQTKAVVDTGTADTKRIHEVMKGETLYRISKEYNISVDKLQRLNNLKQGQDIFPGQRLIVSE